MPPIPVPKFTHAQVVLADICAKELWEGRNFIKRRKQSISEEELLTRFASPALGLMQNPSSTQCFTQNDIDAISDASRIGRFKLPTNTPQAIASFKATISPTYHLWLSKSRKMKRHQFPTQCTIDWSDELVSGLPNKKPHRIALSNRVLFFALPDMPFFIYSGSLAKNRLQISGSPPKSLHKFNDALAAGLKRNHLELSKLSLPPAVTMPASLWTVINQADWWQRRVLDIALMLHFTTSHVKVGLIRRASKLAAPKPKISNKKSTAKARSSKKITSTQT